MTSIHSITNLWLLFDNWYKLKMYVLIFYKPCLKRMKKNANKTFPFRSWGSNWSWSFLWRRYNGWFFSNFGLCCCFDNSSGFIGMDLPFYFQNFSFAKRIWRSGRLNETITIHTSSPSCITFRTTFKSRI